VGAPSACDGWAKRTFLSATVRGVQAAILLSRASPLPRSAHKPRPIGPKSSSPRRFTCHEALEAALLQMDEQQGNRGRRDPRDPRGLTQGLRLVLAELLPRLDAERGHLHVVQVKRQLEVL